MPNIEVGMYVVYGASKILMPEIRKKNNLHQQLIAGFYSTYNGHSAPTTSLKMRFNTS